MGQVKNNDSFLGKAEKLKPVLKHRMLRPVGVVSFERKKADSGADFWNTVGIERLGILSVMLSDEPLAYRGIVIPLLGSYWGGSQGLSSTYEQAHVDERPFDPGIIIIILLMTEKLIVKVVRSLLRRE